MDSKKGVDRDRKKLIAKIDKALSQYIRESNAENGYCICASCGNPYPVKGIQCGHYQSRRYLSTRFSIKNCAPQCARCNCWGAKELSGIPGESEALGRWLDRKWGEGTADLMKAESRKTVKFSILQLEVMLKELQRKLDDLR